MGARPVHLRGDGLYTACCGKSLNLLGHGAKLTEDREEVTCKALPPPPQSPAETYDMPGHPSLEAEEFADGETAFRQAVSEGAWQLNEAVTIHDHGPEVPCGTGCFVGELKLREGDQQLPVPNDEPDIQSQVIADIEARRLVGIQRYGTALQAGNGRDAVRDLYEELLDGACYAKQWLVERERLLARIAELEEEIAILKAEFIAH